MRPVLLDADAFRCLRDLKLLRLLCEQLCPAYGVHLTEYVARFELSQLQAEVEFLEAKRWLSVHRLLKGSPEQIRYRQFQRDGLADKGECEAVAWALSQEGARRAVFITRDKGATRFATAQGVRTTDVLGIVAEALRKGFLVREHLREALAPWDDPQIQLCRPAGYQNFDQEVDARLARDPELFVEDGV